MLQGYKIHLAQGYLALSMLYENRSEALASHQANTWSLALTRPSH